MFFWNSIAFLVIQQVLAIWFLVLLGFLNPVWTSESSWFMYCWSLARRILSINLLVCGTSAIPSLNRWKPWCWEVSWFDCFVCVEIYRRVLCWYFFTFVSQTHQVTLILPSRDLWIVSSFLFFSCPRLILNISLDLFQFSLFFSWSLSIFWSFVLNPGCITDFPRNIHSTL